MTEVFADTSYSIALLSPSDEAYEKAHSVTVAMQAKLVTTEWVLAELGNALARSRTRAWFIQTLRALHSNPGVIVVKADSDSFNTGAELYASRLDKDWSLTDCISFIVMKERNISQALTGDRHFEQAGLQVLLK